MIGYSLLKDHELLIDYSSSRLHLFLEGESEYHSKIQALKEVSFQYVAHIPSLECEISGKNFFLGLDTGGSRNLINQASFDGIPKEEVAIKGIETLSGGNKGKINVKIFSVKSIKNCKREYQRYGFCYSRHFPSPGKKRAIRWLVGLSLPFPEEDFH